MESKRSGRNEGVNALRRGHLLYRRGGGLLMEGIIAGFAVLLAAIVLTEILIRNA